MAPSLKERYDGRKLQQLQERAHVADAQLLKEHRVTVLLLETMDAEDLNKVEAIIDKLDTIKAPELPHLSAAVEQAQAELNKYTGGGPLTKAWTKLKSFVGIDNPVVKITTFADALERGFSQIPQILKNNGVNLQKADLTKSLASMLSAPAPTGKKTDKQMAADAGMGKGGDKEKTDIPGQVPGGTHGDEHKNVTGAADDDDTDYAGAVKAAAGGNKPGTAPLPPQKPNEPKHTGGQSPPPKQKGKKPMPYKGPGSSGNGFSDDQNNWFKKGNNEGVEELDEAQPPKAPSGEQKMKAIADQIRKALAPGGIFGAFKKVPYIDGATLANELMQAPLKVFSNVAKKIQAGAKASEVAPDLKSQVQGQGGEQTQHAAGEDPVKQTGQTQPGQPTKPGIAPTGTTDTGQSPPKGPGQQRGGGSDVKSKGMHHIIKDSGAKDPESAQAVINHLIKKGLLDKSKVDSYGPGNVAA